MLLHVNDDIRCGFDANSIANRQAKAQCHGYVHAGCSRSVPHWTRVSSGTRSRIITPLSILPMECGNHNREPLPPSQNVYPHSGELGSGQAVNSLQKGYPTITASSRAVGLRHLSANRARLWTGFVVIGLRCPGCIGVGASKRIHCFLLPHVAL